MFRKRQGRGRGRNITRKAPGTVMKAKRRMKKAWKPENKVIDHRDDARIVRPTGKPKNRSIPAFNTGGVVDHKSISACEKSMQTKK